MGLVSELMSLIQHVGRLQEQFKFTEPEFQFLAEAKFYLEKVLEIVSKENVPR